MVCGLLKCFYKMFPLLGLGVNWGPAEHTLLVLLCFNLNVFLFTLSIRLISSCLPCIFTNLIHLGIYWESCVLQKCILCKCKRYIKCIHKCAKVTHVAGMCTHTAVSQTTEFTEVELILDGCYFKFPGQLRIWAGKRKGKLKPSISNYCQCALEHGSCTWQPPGCGNFTWNNKA